MIIFVISLFLHVKCTCVHKEMRKWALFCMDAWLKTAQPSANHGSHQNAANHKRAGTLRQSPSSSKTHVTFVFHKTAWQLRCCLLAEENRREELVDMATDIDSFVSFEEAIYDEYDYYNLEEYPCHAGGKGRSKKEIELNTNRHIPAGHERKIAGKLQNSEIKRRRTKSSSSWGTCLEVRMMSLATCLVHQLLFNATSIQFPRAAALTRNCL